MAVNDTLNSIKTHLEEIYDNLASRGAVIPEDRNFNNLPEAIQSLSGSGGVKLFKTKAEMDASIVTNDEDYTFRNLSNNTAALTTFFVPDHFELPEGLFDNIFTEYRQMYPGTEEEWPPELLFYTPDTIIKESNPIFSLDEEEQICIKLGISTNGFDGYYGNSYAIQVCDISLREPNERKICS